MYLSKFIVENYKSFGPNRKEIYFNRGKNVIIGKNNSGKSNIFLALDILLGNRHPRYIKINESDLFDPEKPVKISVEILAESEGEIYETMATKKSKDVFYSKYQDDSSSAKIELKFDDSLDDDYKPENGKFELKVAGIGNYQKINDVKSSILKITKVPAIRKVKDELKGTSYTVFGNLMKDIVENSDRYPELIRKLDEINDLFEKTLEKEKKKILKNAQLITYINDIKFQLTRDNEPSELTKNLEVFVKDIDKFIHIDETGTGTQNAVILSLLELALINRTERSKAFLIEEPEAFIHPQGIKYIASLFDDIIRDDISQIILTTHSIPLLSQFSPSEIIRLDKENGITKINQFESDFKDESKRIIRSLLSNNSEMYYADKVILVEGETELIIFPELSKNVELKTGETANLLSHNITTVNCRGRDRIINFVKVLDQFEIEWVALVDNDFLSNKQHYSKPCEYLNIEKDLEPEEMRNKFSEKGFGIIKKGEIEDLIPNEDLAEMSNKSIHEIEEAKSQYPDKTSAAFKNIIFNKSKAEYGFDIVEYYSKKNDTPFDPIIKWFIEKNKVSEDG